MKKYSIDITQHGYLKLIEKIFQQYPNSVIINGNDYWYVDEYFNPNYFVRLFGFSKNIIAEVSFIKDQKRTGVLISKKCLPKIKNKYLQQFKKHLEVSVEVFDPKKMMLTKIYN